MNEANREEHQSPMKPWSFILGSLGLACICALPVVSHAQFQAIQAGCAHTSSAIDVRVHGVRSDHGYVTFVLYGEDPDHFLAKGKKIYKQRFTAEQGTLALCVTVPEPGIYAATVYHDENGNTKFDKNWIGLPVEGFGVSNNPKVVLGPPSHAQAAFQVQSSPREVHITLHY